MSKIAPLASSPPPPHADPLGLREAALCLFIEKAITWCEGLDVFPLALVSSTFKHAIATAMREARTSIASFVKISDESQGLTALRVTVTSARDEHAYVFFYEYYYYSKRTLSLRDIVMSDKHNDPLTTRALMRACIGQVQSSNELPEVCSPLFPVAVDMLTTLKFRLPVVHANSTAHLKMLCERAPRLVRSSPTLHLLFDSETTDVDEFRAAMRELNLETAEPLACSSLELSALAAQLLRPLILLQLSNVHDLAVPCAFAMPVLLLLNQLKTLTLKDLHGHPNSFVAFDTVLGAFKKNPLKELHTLSLNDPQEAFDDDTGRYSTPRRGVSALLSVLHVAAPNLTTLCLNTRSSTIDLLSLIGAWDDGATPLLQLKTLRLAHYDSRTCLILMHSDTSRLLAQLNTLDVGYQWHGDGCYLSADAAAAAVESVFIRDPSLKLFVNMDIETDPHEAEDEGEDENEDEPQTDPMTHEDLLRLIERTKTWPAARFTKYVRDFTIALAVKRQEWSATADKR